MTNTIFDLVDREYPDGKKGFMEAASDAPQPKDDSFLNQVSDYGKTILKGTIEGVTRFGRVLGPLPNQPDVLERQTEALDKLLPTDEGFVQSSMRRGLREAPSAIASLGGTQALPRALAAGFLGEGAKKLGAPEWLQTAAEITAYIGPDVTKKLLEKGSNAELIKAAKEMGLSDEAITPLIQSEFKQKWLSKLAPKRGSTEKALGETKSQLSQAYSKIQKSEEAAKLLPQKTSEKLFQTFDKILFEMPSAVRDKIKKDLNDLKKNPVTGDSLINFFSDINHYLGDNAKQLSLLKKPIKEALTELSPNLGKDFEIINDLYVRYFNIAGKLKPNITSDIVNAAESIGLMGSLATGYYPGLVGFLGEKGARKLAQQMLVNPHFQQLSKKMVVALNNNKYNLANKITQDFKKEIGKFSPEISEKIENFSQEEFEQLLNLHQKAESE